MDKECNHPALPYPADHSPRCGWARFRYLTAGASLVAVPQKDLDLLLAVRRWY